MESASVNHIMAEYQRLSPEEKAQVKTKIHQDDVKINYTSGDIFIRYKSTTPSKSTRKPLSSRRSDASRSVKYQNDIVKIVYGNYLDDYEQLWLLESLIGKFKLIEQIKKNPVINSKIIEELFRSAPFSFYLDSESEYLISQNNELNDYQFGPLTEITAFDALRRFGLKKMEMAKEKVYIRL
jgi:hypothetical protein